MTGARLKAAVTTLAVVTVVAAWTAWLRPQFLGGPTAIVVVSGTSMEPGLHTRDLVIVRRQASYRAGDVVAYRVTGGGAGDGGVVIHRIVGGDAASGYLLQGDNRETRDQWRPRPHDVLGRQWIALPTSHGLLTSLTSPLMFAALAALVAFALVAIPSPRGV